MSESAPEKSTFGAWVDGEVRFDQVAYDKALKERVQNTSSWTKTWVKWLYDRDLGVDQASMNLVHKMAVDYSAAALLEKKYPQVRTIKSYWPMWTAYLYLKKPAEFHTVLFTAVDNSFRSFFKEYPAHVENAEIRSNPISGHDLPADPYGEPKT
jgi:hypothetical protein